MTARGIVDAPSTVGNGGHRLTITVQNATDGQPLAGAGVVAYWDGTTVAEAQEAGESRAPGQAVPGEEYPTIDIRKTLRANTGPDGRATLRVPEGIVVGIVAAAEGHTEEWMPGVPTSGPSSEHAVTLYQTRIELAILGAWGPGAASSGFLTGSAYQWDPNELQLGFDGPTHAGYAARLHAAAVTLTWENGPTGGGDLGIGLGPDGGSPTLFDDGSDNIAFGPQEEKMAAGYAEVVEHGLNTGTLHVGPATKSGFLAPGGLDYAITVVLDFEGARPDFGCTGSSSTTDDSEGFGISTPGTGLAVALALLAALAFFARRRE